MSDQPYTGPEVEAAVKILREDALISGHRALAERMERMEDQLKRIPGKEMTAEEKAAEYDKIMAERGKPPAKPEPPEPPDAPPAGTPAPPPAKVSATEPSPQKRDPWFGDALS